MELKPEKKIKLTKWIIGITATAIVIFLGLQNLRTVSHAVAWAIGLFTPLLIGLAIALILNVPMSAIESKLWRKTQKPFLKKLRRPIAFLSALLLIIGILVGIFMLILPELIGAVKVIIDNIINYINTFSSMTTEELEQMPFGKMLLSIDWDALVLTAQNWVANQSGNIINTTVSTISTVVGGLFNFFMAMAFAIYILFDKENLKRQFRRLICAWIPDKFSYWVLHTFQVLGGNLRSFVAGQTLEALILGLLCMIGMLILKIPYAPMVGTLIGVTALIPVVGAFGGAFVGAFMILTADPLKALVFLIFQVEGNLIYPKVMGSRINLPSIWVLGGVTVGGSLGGPVGMLLGVPVTAATYTIVRELTELRECRKAKIAAEKAETQKKPEQNSLSGACAMEVDREKCQAPDIEN